MKFSFISRLRSRREIQGQPEEVSDQQAVVEGDGGCGGDCCSWTNLPPELLREVVSRIEDSENCWPERQTVVACAGVCRSWRVIVKDIVEIPEISGKLTFPSSVNQPGPKDGLLQCFIKRNRSNQTYYLYLGLTNDTNIAEDGKFLLAARKYSHATCNEYIISFHAEDMSKGSSSYVGKLRSNYLRNRFTIFDGQSSNRNGSKMARNHSSRLSNLKQASSGVTFVDCPMAHISYELEVFGIRGPRRIKCMMETIPATSVAPEGAARTPAKFSRCNMEVSRSNPIVYSKSASTGDFLSKSKSGEKNDALVLINKAPKWHEQLYCWCLNFHGRVTVASVKNFQLVASPGNGKVVLQFGKVGKDFFTMDYRYPISAFQAFAICLSSFDTKVACE